MNSGIWISIYYRENHWTKVYSYKRGYYGNIKQILRHGKFETRLDEDGIDLKNSRFSKIWKRKLEVVYPISKVQENDCPFFCALWHTSVLCCLLQMPHFGLGLQLARSCSHSFHVWAPSLPGKWQDGLIFGDNYHTPILANPDRQQDPLLSPKGTNKLKRTIKFL